MGRLINKPMLRRSRSIWTCTGNPGWKKGWTITAAGITPKAAYFEWLLRCCGEGRTDGEALATPAEGARWFGARLSKRKKAVVPFVVGE